MAKLPLQHRLLWIALAAVVGMVSLPGAASACLTKQANAPRSCCASRPASACGCCTTEASPPASVDAPLAESASSLVTATVHEARSGSCECRANDPASPSGPRPAERRAEKRSEFDRYDSFSNHSAPLQVRVPLARLLMSNAVSPKSPLYLRISHLLI